MTPSPFVLSAVTKHYDGFTLGPLDLEVPRGYVTALVGPNGAGKTTAIKLGLGACLPTSGRVHLLDKTRVGVVLDTPPWPSHWKVRELGTLLRPFYPNWDQARFERLAQWAGAEMKKKIGELSRGAGMKLQLAFALALGAELLILDEPTSGLDPLARTELLDQVAEFMTDERHAVLFSSHITSDLERIADRLVVLDSGQVTLAGQLDDLREQWALVRGGARGLTPDLEARLHGLRRHPMGWEGLIAAQDLALCGADVVAESPTIEQLLLHLVKEPVHA
ncbi:MAG: ABC transporter ATP-binding protein [Arachnia propionica]|uniref:ABC transporter ATP-binding protein n=1 Tax=Arachnia propionica TaxID=1750 RepID=UPI0026FF16EC|nr:ABC transporter ATP-binding protein [Arachnia propionica]